MAIRVQSDIEAIAVVRDESLTTLQALLSTNGKAVSYEDAARIGQELVGFFEAFGESNDEEAGDA